MIISRVKYPIDFVKYYPASNMCTATVIAIPIKTGAIIPTRYQIRKKL
jgi:hypothetical protein